MSTVDAYTEHPMEFPAGSTLMVQRAASAIPGRFGSLDEVDRPDSHTIGPCSLLESSAGSGGEHQRTPSHQATISAPTGSDVRVGDWLVLPTGAIVTVVGLPIPNSNPWTGWTPRIRVVVEINGWKG